MNTYFEKLLNYFVYIGNKGFDGSFISLVKLYSKNDISKLELQKSLKPNSKHFNKIPEFITESKKHRIATLGIKKTYLVCMNNFIQDIKKCIPYVSLDLFYENCKGLKVIEYDSTTDKCKSVAAHADYYDNGEEKIIRVYNGSNYIAGLIYHELLHMASTKLYYDYLRSGFYYCDLHFCIGEGINEGYTELLTLRYFGNYMSEEENKSSSYPVLVSIMFLIERYFIGKDRMQALYFEQNLPELIEILKDYDTEENIIKFLRKIDFLCLYDLNDSLILRNMYYEILKSVLDTIKKWRGKEINTDYLKSEELKKTCQDHMEFLEDELEYRKKLKKLVI